MSIQCKECRRWFVLQPGSTGLACTCKSAFDEKTETWTDVLTKATPETTKP